MQFLQTIALIIYRLYEYLPAGRQVGPNKAAQILCPVCTLEINE
jgi:hypothetical protein